MTGLTYKSYEYVGGYETVAFVYGPAVVTLFILKCLENEDKMNR
jgi:hypothetical protein